VAFSFGEDEVNKILLKNHGNKIHLLKTPLRPVRYCGAEKISYY